MKLGVTWKQQLGKEECPYAERWVLNLHFFSIRVHHFMHSDDQRNLHSHSWNFITLVLKGGYTDISEAGDDHLRRGSIRYRKADHKHAVKTDPGGVWTILITGPTINQWGFFVKRKDGSLKFTKPNKYFLTHGHHPCEDD